MIRERRTLFGVRKTDWSAEDGLRLASARRRRRHTQQECANELIRLGATNASQGSVSNWEVTRTGPTTEASLAAISEYCREGSDHTDARDATDASMTFEDVVAQLVGAPPLTDRQSQLLDAVLARLEKGPPLSTEDGAALRFAAGVLGMHTRRTG